MGGTAAAVAAAADVPVGTAAAVAKGPTNAAAVFDHFRVPTAVAAAFHHSPRNRQNHYVDRRPPPRDLAESHRQPARGDRAGPPGRERSTALPPFTLRLAYTLRTRCSTLTRGYSAGFASMTAFCTMYSSESCRTIMWTICSSVFVAPTLRIMFTSLSTRIKHVLGSSSGYIVTFSNCWTRRVFSASDTGNVHSVTTPQASRTELQAARFSSISVLHVASKRYCHTFQLSRTVCTPCILSKEKRSLQLITSTGPVEGMVVRIHVKLSEPQKISNRRI